MTKKSDTDSIDVKIDDVCAYWLWFGTQSEFKFSQKIYGRAPIILILAKV